MSSSRAKGLITKFSEVFAKGASVFVKLGQITLVKMMMMMMHWGVDVEL